MANEVHGNGVGYEVTDPPVRIIVYSALGLAAVTILICFLLAGLFRILVAMEETGKRNPLAPAHQLPPEPRVEVHPWEQLQQVRAHEEQQLRTYGWVDKEKGIVRLPIDRAIDLTLQRGLPARKEQGKQ